MKLTVFLILTCKEALDAIKKQTNLDFFYNNQEINAMGKVSVRCRNVSLEAALRQVLGKNFTFRIVDNTVVIRPEEMKPNPVKQQVVKGVVVDAQGLPLPGVTVLLKGTTLGTSTDMDGNFTLNNVSGGTLVISFIGYKTLEVFVKGTNLIKRGSTLFFETEPRIETPHPSSPGAADERVMRKPGT